jgi:hypothetical protein
VSSNAARAEGDEHGGDGRFHICGGGASNALC